MAKETANNGWICLHRAFKDWQHYGDTSVKAVFVDLLLSANHKDGWWRGHKCERGATFVSIRTLAECNGIAINTVQRALKLLEQTGEIKRIKIDQKNTKTIVCKYNVYQDNNLFSVSKCNTQTNTQTDTQTNTKQQYNNNNNIVDVDKKRARTHEEIVADMFASRITIERFCITEGITVEQCRKLADEVLVEWELVGETHRTDKETKQHLLSQIRKKAQAMRLNGTFIAMDEKAKRLQPLIEDCKALIAEGHKKEDVSQFYAFWTENCNDSTGRMRFEAERAWTTKTRFINFLKRKKQ